jgi:hypothetical protein
LEANYLGDRGRSGENDVKTVSKDHAKDTDVDEFEVAASPMDEYSY